MKLKSDFVIQEIDNTQILVPTGTSDFKGMIRTNSTASIIINMLRSDTTEGEIIAEMYRLFPENAQEIDNDVREFLNLLRSLNALEE